MIEIYQTNEINVFQKLILMSVRGTPALQFVGHVATPRNRILPHLREGFEALCKLTIEVSRYIQSLFGERITEIVRHSLPDAKYIGTAELPGLPALADIEIRFFVDDMEFEPKSEAGASPGGAGPS